MGFGIKELLVILVIVILLFGTKKLKSLGSDLGGAVKGFKKSLQDEEEASKLEDQSADTATDVEAKQTSTSQEEK